MSHCRVFLDVLFAGEPLPTDEALVRLWVGVSSSMNVQTAALRKLFTTQVTGEGFVTCVGALVRRQVTDASELTVTPCTGVQCSVTSRVGRVHVSSEVQLTDERLATPITHVRQTQCHVNLTCTRHITRPTHTCTLVEECVRDTYIVALY